MTNLLDMCIFQSTLLRRGNSSPYFVTYFDGTTRSPGRQLIYEKSAENVLESVHPLNDRVRQQVANLTTLIPLVDQVLANPDPVLQTLPLDVPAVRKEVKSTVPRAPASAVREWRLSYLEEYLSALETAIADQVLATDPRGYSTTTGDLIRDLIP
jgi:hypothetical protein